MPPQFDHPWGSASLGLPGADEESLDLNIFDDLFLDDSPLFPDALLDACPSDLMEDFLGSSLVRHDCMWAGTCVDDNKDRPNPLPRLQESPVKCCPMPALTPYHETPTKDTDSVPTPVTSVTPSSRAKCNQRSILRTNVNLASASVVSSDPLRTASQDESDDSGRPDTPLSMEGSVPDPAEFKHDYELASSCLGDEEEEEEDDDDDDDDEEEEEDEDDDDSEEEDEDTTMVNAAEAKGQTVRTPSQQHASRFDSRPQQMAVSNHFFNDHSYHLSKDVSASIPGNLTPSDSGEHRSHFSCACFWAALADTPCVAVGRLGYALRRGVWRARRVPPPELAHNVVQPKCICQTFRAVWPFMPPVCSHFKPSAALQCRAFKWPAGLRNASG